MRGRGLEWDGGENKAGECPEGRRITESHLLAADWLGGPGRGWEGFLELDVKEKDLSDNHNSKSGIRRLRGEKKNHECWLLTVISRDVIEQGSPLPCIWPESLENLDFSQQPKQCVAMKKQNE